MFGKIVKISNNDLYGNADDRKVSVFAVFNHKKYMNKYIIFSMTDEYNKKKLYYGSVHIKTNSLVVFRIDDSHFPYIDEFTKEYLNNNLSTSEYEILNIENIEKIELVSYNTIDFDRLYELDSISIKKTINTTEEVKNKKPVFLYFLLFLMIALLIGVTYIYLNPTILDKEYKELTCTKDSYNKKVDMDYSSEILIKFDEEDKAISIDVTDIYTFTNRQVFETFRDNQDELKYFNINGEYKYNSDTLELKIFYNDQTVINEYNELKEHYENNGYSCLEGTYNE